MSGTRLLFVDDDISVQRAFTRSLNGLDLTIECAEGVAAAVAALQATSYDVLVTDMSMPDGNGLDVLNAASKLAPRTVCAVVSGAPDIRATLADYPVTFILEKPWNVSELRSQIKKAITIAASRAAVS